MKVPARENEAKAAIHTWMESASVYDGTARAGTGWPQCAMDANMGIRCWILVVFVIEIGRASCRERV